MYYVLDSNSILFQHEQKPAATQWLADNPGEGRQVVQPVLAIVGPDPAQFPALAYQRQAQAEARELLHPFLAHLQQTKGLGLLSVSAGEGSLVDEAELTEAYLAFRDVDTAQAQTEFATYAQRFRPPGSRSIERVIVDLETGDETSVGYLAGKGTQSSAQ